MSHESLVYGCIVGARWKIEDFRRLQRLNRTVIAELPETDEWPFLTRSMFSIPGDDFVEGTYQSQLIHFGGTFSQIEWTWHEWLPKFEALLARLFWQDVYLHLKTKLVGNYDYHYKVLDYLENFYKLEPPRPASKWRLDGGVRRFPFRDSLPENERHSSWLYADGVWRPNPEAPPTA